MKYQSLTQGVRNVGYTVLFEEKVLAVATYAKRVDPPPINNLAPSFIGLTAGRFVDRRRSPATKN